MLLYFFIDLSNHFKLFTHNQISRQSRRGQKKKNSGTHLNVCWEVPSLKDDADSWHAENMNKITAEDSQTIETLVQHDKNSAGGRAYNAADSVILTKTYQQASKPKISEKIGVCSLLLFN